MSSVETHVHTVLARASARAWGVATGLLLALGVFVATNVLVFKGGENVGAHLGRIGQVFPGYDVTFTGSLIGAVYAFVVGYALGRLLAPRRPMELEERSPASRQRHVRLNGRAFGWGLGGLLAIALFAVTNVLVLRGGEDVGALLNHLGIYLPGYDVSFSGSVVGAAYLFGLGWLAGRAVSGLYNGTVQLAEG